MTKLFSVVFAAVLALFCIACMTADTSRGTGSYGSTGSPSSSGGSGGSVYVNGYYRRDGTYVHPYTRAAPGSGRSGGRR